jgi:hypothetical protein
MDNPARRFDLAAVDGLRFRNPVTMLMAAMTEAAAPEHRPDVGVTVILEFDDPKR